MGYSFSASSLFPGIIIETDDAAFRLSSLLTAGNYRQLLLPLNNRAALRNRTNGILFDAATDGDLTDNFIILCNASEFPDVPITLVLEKKPAKIVMSLDNAGRVNNLDIVAKDGNFGRVIITFPRGIESLEPAETTEDDLIKTIERSRFWSKAVLCYPAGVSEFFRINGDTVEIVSRFKYRELKDEWNSRPIKLAPLPPPIGLVNDIPGLDLEFPTKYGPLRAFTGTGSSAYILKIPPVTYPIFPRGADDNSLPERLEADFASYLKFYETVNKVDEIHNPGVYSLLWQFELPMLLFPLLNKERRETLKKILSDNLKIALDPESHYTYHDGRDCCFWHKRTEPFSGVDYLMTYLHIYGITKLPDCNRETVENYPVPFYEVDWGNGMALYSIYLAVMFTGEYDLARKHWETIRGAFNYFLKTMDYPCMAAAYAENGKVWNDGTNYGGYLGFIRLAQLVNDLDAVELGLYAFAKLGASRMAQLKIGIDFMPRFFASEQVHCARAFFDETDGGNQFTHASGLARSEALYNMTTEGHYPEAFEFYATRETELVRKMLAAALEHWKGKMFSKIPDDDNVYHPGQDYPGQQQLFTWFMLACHTCFESGGKLGEMLEEALENNRLSGEYLGAPFGKRRVPAGLVECMLKQTIRKGPQLGAWKNLDIENFTYDDKNNQAEIIIANCKNDAWIELKNIDGYEIRQKNAIPRKSISSIDKTVTVVFPKDDSPILLSPV